MPLNTGKSQFCLNHFIRNYKEYRTYLDKPFEVIVRFGRGLRLEQFEILFNLIHLKILL